MAFGDELMDILTRDRTELCDALRVALAIGDSSRRHHPTLCRRVVSLAAKGERAFGSPQLQDDPGSFRERRFADLPHS